MSVEIAQENNVVEIIEENATLVEVTTEGPQGPPGPAGGGLTQVELAAGDTALTTTGSQIVVCNNTNAAVVTLNLTPANGEIVHIKRKAGPVTVAGIIDGVASRTIDGPTDAPLLVFSTITNDWLIL